VPAMPPHMLGAARRARAGAKPPGYLAWKNVGATGSGWASPGAVHQHRQLSTPTTRNSRLRHRMAFSFRRAHTGAWRHRTSADGNDRRPSPMHPPARATWRPSCRDQWRGQMPARSTREPCRIRWLAP
jgi:hypothetical protein